MGSEQGLVPYLFGWPGILVALLLSVVGLSQNKAWLVLSGAALSLPFAWLLSGYPFFQASVFLAPLSNAGAAFAVWKGKQNLAWLLMMPWALVVTLVAFFVLTQQTG